MTVEIPRLISIKDVCKLTSLSRTSIDKLRKSGNFPKDVKLGPKRIAFVRTEVLEWVEERIADR